MKSNSRRLTFVTWIRPSRRARTARKLLLAAPWLASSVIGLAQGTFQNLDFESAVVPVLASDQPAFVPFTNAFPGWIGYSGTNQFSVALYNGYSLGAALVS